jgi:hypothetical protein
MTRRVPTAALIAALALVGCGGEEESFSDRYNRISGEIVNKGAAYEAQAENMVSQEERLRDAEGEAMANQTRNELANAANSANSVFGFGNGSE